MMRVDGNAEALSIKGIEALAVTAESDKFYGCRGAKAQGMKAPGGFGIVVTASGVKSFVLHNRIAGRERRYTIGHCSTWQVAKAIKAARELRQRIETGDDPLLDHTPVADPIKQPTVKEIHGAWLNRPKRRDKPNTPQRLSFARHTLPFKLGDGCNALTLGDIPYRGMRKSQEAELHDKSPVEAGPCAAGYKTGADQVVPLPDVALAILGARPKRRDRRVCTEFNYSRKKVIADKAVRLERWTLHDLRRTAATIMAKARVRPDISERVLGHLIPAAEGVYDRHDYLAEKRDALERLEAAIDHILYPVENVIELVRA